MRGMDRWCTNCRVSLVEKEILYYSGYRTIYECPECGKQVQFFLPENVVLPGKLIEKAMWGGGE